MQIDSFAIYSITTLMFLVPYPLLFYFGHLSTLKMVVLLFSLDTALTIEAAYYGNVVMIAVLHVVTVPIFFGLLYLDLIKQSKTDFKCFLCGEEIQPDGNVEVVKRHARGKLGTVMVHSSCLETGRKERKAFSERIFRRGTPK